MRLHKDIYIGCSCGWGCRYPETLLHGWGSSKSTPRSRTEFYTARVEEHWRATGHEARLETNELHLNFIYPGGHVLDFLDRNVMVGLHLGFPIETALEMREDVWEQTKAEFHRRFLDAMKNPCKIN